MSDQETLAKVLAMQESVDTNLSITRSDIFKLGVELKQIKDSLWRVNSRIVEFERDAFFAKHERPPSKVLLPILGVLFYVVVLKPAFNYFF